MGGRGRVRDMVQEGPGHAPRIQPRRRRGGPVDVQGVQRGRTVDDGSRAAAVVLPGLPSCPDQGGEARRVQGGGHGDERQVAAQLADLGEHAEQQVGLQSAFVDLVEDHGVGVPQARIREQAAQQDPGGDELHQRSGSGLAFAADGVPDAVPEPAAVQGARRARPSARRRGAAGSRRCAAARAGAPRCLAGRRRTRGWRAAAEPAWFYPCRAGPGLPQPQPGRPHAALRRAPPASRQKPGRRRGRPGRRARGRRPGPGKQAGKSPVHCARKLPAAGAHLQVVDAGQGCGPPGQGSAVAPAVSGDVRAGLRPHLQHPAVNHPGGARDVA